MRKRYTRAEILRFSENYSYGSDDQALAHILKGAANRGWLRKEDLLSVARWKWKGGRVSGLVENNPEEDIRQVSLVAFSTDCERLRIGAIRCLEGVGWPMASVVLHFAFENSYPILDRRVMSSVGSDTKYSFSKWLKYCEFMRAWASELDVSMRQLDRALWQADKDG